MTESQDYRVSLDVYSGPLDLLLFLIQRDEIDVYDIPISRITKQYVEYVELLRLIDPEVVSEFLVLAATLMEIKSRMLLPSPPPDETDEEMIDPRLELVRQLLEYKLFKDAAHSLDAAATERALKHARLPAAAPITDDDIEIENLDIWDLFEAFNGLLKQIGKAGATYKIDVDDTPVELHADDILDSIDRAGGKQAFEEIFSGRTKGEMIGLFLALLELIRRHRIRVVQERAFGPILLYLLDRRPLDHETDLEEQGPQDQAPNDDTRRTEESAEPSDDASPPARPERGQENDDQEQTHEAGESSNVLSPNAPKAFAGAASTHGEDDPDHDVPENPLCPRANDSLN